MIYCVWYPSGGFGHFINAVLTLHGDNFVRPKKTLKFSANGDSHSLDLIVPKYLHERWPGGIEFLNDKNYCVLVDNGINNESAEFKNTFPNSTVIKICYYKYSWPVVARTMIEKAMRSSMDAELPVDAWNTNEPWAKREKYFLYLRNHPLRNAWQASDDNSLDVAEIYEDYTDCHTYLNAIVPVEGFYDMWKEWRETNATYIDPVITAKNVLNCVLADHSVDLTHITDTWTQAVIYYYIWVRFNVEVPHNDFAGFFSNTDQIKKLVS